MLEKKIASLLIVLVLIVFAGGCQKGYESKKTAGGMHITLNAERYPLIKGDNTITIKVTDSAGNAVTDANVDARFYMPPMPGMAPMDTTTRALVSGDKYMFTGNVPMEGGWKLEVSVSQQGKSAVRTLFNLDAR